jgi:hypothetical protein
MEGADKKTDRSPASVLDGEYTCGLKFTVLRGFRYYDIFNVSGARYVAGVFGNAHEGYTSVVLIDNSWSKHTIQNCTSKVQWFQLIIPTLLK